MATLHDSGRWVLNFYSDAEMSLPHELNADPAGGLFAYVTNLASANVSVIDVATNTVVGSPIPVGSTPFSIAITPDGTSAYVANLGSHSVSVIATPPACLLLWMSESAVIITSVQGSQESCVRT